jgi:hypothetical protein
MKEFTCVVKLEFGGNNFNAKNKKAYTNKVKESFQNEFGIDLVDNEIKEIEEQK